MDWSALALQIAERAHLSAIVLDARSQLLLVSPAAEQLLGMSSDSLGNDWVERFVVPAAAASARWYLDRAFAGALRKLELPLRTPDGTGIGHFEASPVGRGQEAGLLLMLEQLVPLPREAVSTDYDYEVLGIATRQLSLKRLWRPGFEPKARQGACFEVLHGRSAPCEQCPLLRESRERANEHMVYAKPPHDYVVATFTRQGDDQARVSVRSLTTTSLAAVLQARLDELAARARLSKRERSVFGFLMDGRAVEEIATELAISPRTVKFHQANVLQKLGADSRTDLIRLVL